MAQATSIRNIKKQAPVGPTLTTPTLPKEKPHKNLTRIQEEVAELCSDLILTGGSPDDVMPFLAAAYRHKYRRLTFTHCALFATPLNERAISYGKMYADDAFKHLAKRWPEPSEKLADDEDNAKRTTVKEIAQADLRNRLRTNFENFLCNTEGVEALWLWNEILIQYGDGEIDFADAISKVVDHYDDYVRVHWEKADKVRKFAALLGDEEAR
jgi:hypothetical protein